MGQDTEFAGVGNVLSFLFPLTHTRRGWRTQSVTLAKPDPTSAATAAAAAVKDADDAAGQLSLSYSTIPLFITLSLFVLSFFFNDFLGFCWSVAIDACVRFHHRVPLARWYIFCCHLQDVLEF